jgi:hypothetical protein
MSIPPDDERYRKMIKDGLDIVIKVVTLIKHFIG